MSSSSKTLVEIFTQTSEFLNFTNWGKRVYFNYTSKCYCAHAALQLTCNPALIGFNGVSAMDIHHVEDRGPACAAADGARAAKEHVSLKEAWDQRPQYVKFVDPERGSLEAHYFAGAVGLTTDFNDDESTTLEMVQTKFMAAAELAAKLGI